MSKKLGGTVNLKVNGDIYKAKGSFNYSLGLEKKEAVLGVDGVHGYKSSKQVPMIEGEITITPKVNIKNLLSIGEEDNVTVTLDLNQGSVIVLRNAWINTEGTIETEESKMSVKFEGIQAEQIR